MLPSVSNYRGSGAGTVMMGGEEKCLWAAIMQSGDIWLMADRGLANGQQFQSAAGDFCVIVKWDFRGIQFALLMVICIEIDS